MSTSYRSGAVARMLRMPVATLRVWERRYALTDSQRSPSGQRLYSPEDVQRLALIKQLSDVGHAIGQLASLPVEELRTVMATHAGALAARPRAAAKGAAPGPVATAADGCSWALTGPGAAALLQRLQRPLLRRLLSTPAGAPRLWSASDEAPARPLDWLVHVAPQLPAPEALPLARASRHAVLYRFGSEREAQRLLAAGVLLLGEPQPDGALASWLGLLLQQPPWPQAGASAAPSATPQPVGEAAIPPRRWDDAALADFASLSTTVACECPRHLAEILMQLSHFEAYCASCQQQCAQSPSEAALHAQLGRLTASARSLFEQGLEQVARHEGLLVDS